MIDATTLYGGATVFSPWFPRGGDFASMTAECIQLTGSNSFELRLYHKNSADTGDGTEADGTKLITLSAVGRTTVDWKRSGTMLGFKELVRYYLKMSGGGSDSIRFRVLPPIWYDDVVEP